MKFPYPFRYTPSERIKAAASSLIDEIAGRGDALCGSGKMMGVMIAETPDCKTVTLRAFSGLWNGKSVIEGFVPPILDTTKGWFEQQERLISAMPSGSLKSEASVKLQDWLFENYIVHNARGETSSIKDIFAARGLVPPGGTGECAAPKLLEFAYRNNLKPIEMGEFWYGPSPQREVREQGRFYPSCFGKCGPLLTWMMQGLDVEDNPLDKPFIQGDPSVIYYDDEIIVADKPSGMLSVPGRTVAPCLLDFLSSRFGEVHSCHRLDMDTSGIIVYARNTAAKANLEAQFSQRTVVKTYRARLSSPGPSAPNLRSLKTGAHGTVALPLFPDYYDRPRQTVDAENGKTSVTLYEVLGELPNGEIDVLFTPKTGRSHQLRVHSAHVNGLGRPIKGDHLYGDPSSDFLFLRADSIDFTHPRTGERMYFKLDCPTFSRPNQKDACSEGALQGDDNHLQGR